MRSTKPKFGNRRKVALLAAVAASAVMSLSANAETDVYGNEIRTYSEGGVTKTYQFWVDGTKAEVATFAGSSTAPSSFAIPLEARFRTWFKSLGAALRADKFRGLSLIVR